MDDDGERQVEVIRVTMRLRGLRLRLLHVLAVLVNRLGGGVS